MIFPLKKLLLSPKNDHTWYRRIGAEVLEKLDITPAKILNAEPTDSQIFENCIISYAYLDTEGFVILQIRLMVWNSKETMINLIATIQYG